MPRQTPEQRIAELEKKLQAHVQDYAEQIYGHRGPVVYDDLNGWTLDVTPEKVAVDA